ncbi:hypothetical protein [Nonomuraea sp. SYSU D8015]|uniref:hypothetical protein n=1 Tax=Nonomuraea sp. SYSU D8015 TaxID=2593644 RepID=UPI0016603C5F|nr:hypothetical protein [Nonomuraea sp. SYSU D8015]
MSLFLGIDQSFGGFGLTRLYDGYADISVVKFTATKYGKGVDRLMHVERWLGEQICLLPEYPVHVAMEGFSRDSQNRREEAGSLAYAVKRVLRWHLPEPACYPTIIAPTKVKLFASGKGNASKQEVIDGVKERWGIECKNDNEADSYTLARMAKYLTEGYGSDARLHEIRAIKEVVLHTERVA